MNVLNSPIKALGYLGLQAASIDSWSDYATRFLGLQQSDRTSDQARFRMDERSHRLTVHTSGSGSPNAIAYFGWELADAASLARLAASLEAAGVTVHAASASLRTEREVIDLIHFFDPLGNRLEAFYGAAGALSPFVAGRNHSGFRSGALGLGHVVLTVTDVKPALEFYRDVLGFGLSDYILDPFKAYFMHVNGRHHSLALIETGTPGVHHLMVEMLGLDDVGQAYDLALGVPERVGTTLGRHTNDYMTSFYARTPSEFMVEIGWGGRIIDPSNWTPIEETAGPSLWGHDRTWLPPEARERARQMKLDAAEQGLRHPVQVISGHYHEVPRA